MDRPNWDTYLMTLAFVVASRSIDPSTQHGCIIVDKEKTILTVGYNSPPRGCNDELIPLTRPEKYPFMVHAEEAAIANAARNGTSLYGSTAYVTGHSCPVCFRMLINAGIKEIIFGPRKSSCVSESEKQIINIMMDSRSDTKIREFSGDFKDLLSKIISKIDS